MERTRDQAYQLRRLVRRHLVASSPRLRPLVIAVCAGSGGVGATTVARCLAECLASDGARVAYLVADKDAAAHGTETEAGTPGWRDVIEDHADFDAVCRWTHGQVSVIPIGGDTSQRETAWETATAVRLFETIDRYLSADYVIADVGAGCRPWTKAWIEGARRTILVCSPDPTAVVAGYSWMKSVGPARVTSTVEVLLNRAGDRQQTAQVQQRLEDACRRFLGIELPCRHVIPEAAGGSLAQPGTVKLWTLKELLNAVEPIAERVRRLRAEQVETYQGNGSASDMRATA